MRPIQSRNPSRYFAGYRKKHAAEIAAFKIEFSAELTDVPSEKMSELDVALNRFTRHETVERCREAHDTVKGRVMSPSNSDPELLDHELFKPVRIFYHKKEDGIKSLLSERDDPVPFPEEKKGRYLEILHHIATGYLNESLENFKQQIEKIAAEEKAYEEEKILDERLLEAQRNREDLESKAKPIGKRARDVKSEAAVETKSSKRKTESGSSRKDDRGDVAQEKDKPKEVKPSAQVKTTKSEQGVKAARLYQGHSSAAAGRS